MQQHIFPFVSELDELQNSTPLPASSHCSSVQERLVTYGSEALDTAEHLGLILGSQKCAEILLKHFGSLTVLARTSVDELLPFISRSKALRLVSSLRMGAVALREERQSLTIDSPLAIAELCSEMRFLDRESLRVVLLDAKQNLITIATVSSLRFNPNSDFRNLRFLLRQGYGGQVGPKPMPRKESKHFFGVEPRHQATASGRLNREMNEISRNKTELQETARCYPLTSDSKKRRFEVLSLTAP